MDAITTIDKAGRLIIPKRMRNALHVKAGDILQLKETPEGLLLQPSTGGQQIKRKGKFWIFSGGEPLTNETVMQVLREGREERETQAIYDALLHACARKVKAAYILARNVKRFRAAALYLAERIVAP